MGKNKNLFVDSNIIYDLCHPFKDPIFGEYMNFKSKKRVYLNKLNSKYQKGSNINDLKKLEDNAVVFRDFFDFYKTFDNVFVPEYVKRQCFHEVTGVLNVGRLFDYRSQEYLREASHRMSSHEMGRFSEGIKLVISYKNIHNFLDKIASNEFSEINYGSSDGLKSFEDFLRDLTNIFELKKNGHSNDRKVDEKLSSLIVYSAFLGNETVSFSNDNDIRKIINFSLLSIKNGSNISSSDNLEKLISNPPTIAKCQTQGNLFFSSGVEFKSDLSICEFLTLEGVKFNDEKLNDLSKATMYFLKDIGCY